MCSAGLIQPQNGTTASVIKKKGKSLPASIEMCSHFPLLNVNMTLLPPRFLNSSVPFINTSKCKRHSLTFKEHASYTADTLYL